MTQRTFKPTCGPLLAVACLLLAATGGPVSGMINPGYRGLFYRSRSTFDVMAPGDVQVNTRTGNLVLQRNLFFVPGRGLPVDFVLTYNTDRRHVPSPVGWGWTLSYFVRYVKDRAGDVTIVWGDGRLDTFRRSGNTYASPPGVYMRLEEPNPGELVLTTKHGIQFVFSNRRLVSVSDPNANTLTLSYDADRRLSSVQGAGRQPFLLEYDATGRLAALRDPNLDDRSFALIYDAEGRLTAITDPLSNQERFDYDADNLITQVTDRRGNPAVIAYSTSAADTRTPLPATIGKGGVTSTFAFDPATRTTLFTDPNGNAWTYVYDASERVARTGDPAGNTTEYTWDGTDNLLSRTDRNGNRTGYTYDAQGNPVRVTDPLGNRITQNYEPNYSRLTFLIDRNGNGWTFQYDGRGNLTGVVTPLNQTTGITVDDAGQPVTVTNALGHATRFDYDAAGNLTRITDPLGRSSSAAYDGANRLVRVTDANGNTVSQAYDALDRLLSITDGLGQSARYSYDAEGLPVSITDRNGNIRTRTYDSLNRIVSTTDALGNSRGYSHDAVGQRVSITDELGRTTRFAYDSRGRMTEKTLPLNRLYRFAFDNEGNLQSRVDPNGQMVQWAYDANDRLVRRTLPGPFVTDFAYDNNGNLVSASDPNSNFNLVYDQLNRLIGLVDNGLGRTMSLAYDAAGRKTSVGRPDGDVQTYVYDAAGRLVRMTIDGRNVEFGYDPGGRRVRRVYPNGVVTDYQYDAADRMISLVSSNASGTLQSFRNTYDGEGNLLREIRHNGESTMTYDAMNRLTRETRTGPVAYDVTLTRDARGNVLRASGTPFFPNSPQSFTYDGANRISTYTGTGFLGAFSETFTYDANGNLVRRAGVGAATVTYGYDALNRIVTGSDSGSGTENYAYDALGRLATIGVSNPIATETALQRLFYDEHRNVMVVYTAAGQVFEQYWHNDNVPQKLQPTSTLQLPTFTFGSVNTVVSVPDGGTVLLGGIKRLYDRRNAGTYLLRKGNTTGTQWLGQKIPYLRQGVGLTDKNTLGTSETGQLTLFESLNVRGGTVDGSGLGVPQSRIRLNVDNNDGLASEIFSIYGGLNDPFGAGDSRIVGFGTEYGRPTEDLDLQFQQGSFELSGPPLGGFDAGTGANFGFAILSDIEAFFFLQAAQADRRSNILEAPKVTLFNGQAATVSDSRQLLFVASLIPVVN